MGAALEFAVSFASYQQIDRVKAKRCNLERFRVKLLPFFGVLACLWFTRRNLIKIQSFRGMIHDGAGREIGRLMSRRKVGDSGA